MESKGYILLSGFCGCERIVRQLKWVVSVGESGPWQGNVVLPVMLDLITL